MSDNVVRHEKYICADSADNHNKYWYVWVFDSGLVRTKWGRVGKESSSQEKDFPGAGVSFAETKIREKLKKGYRKIDTIDSVEDNSSPVKTSNTGLKTIATQQIKHSNPIVKSLIEYLTAKNAHNIFTQSGGKIQYVADTGLFKTPLGIITKDNIDQARTLLTSIGDWVANRDFDNRSFTRTLDDYMMLIPQDTGMKRFGPQTIFPDLTAVQKQNDVLDSLETSYTSAISVPKVDDKDKKDEPVALKIFDVQMELVEDKGEIKRIDVFYRSSKNRQHYDAYDYKIKQIFTINMPSSIEAFNKQGRPLGSLFQVFHGSSTANYLSVLRSGLRCSPPRSTHLTGAMFGGRSIYTSDQSTKALRYCIGSWGGGRFDRTFLLVADIAMGKYYVPSGADSNLPKKGYDSTFAKANVSGVMNNELVIYRDYQINLTHLIELEK